VAFDHNWRNFKRENFLIFFFLKIKKFSHRIDEWRNKTTAQIFDHNTSIWRTARHSRPKLAKSNRSSGAQSEKGDIRERRGRLEMSNHWAVDQRGHGDCQHTNQAVRSSSIEQVMTR